MRNAIGFSLFLFALSGCGNAPEAKAPVPAARATASSNPVAKYLEVVGFRIQEKGAGKLEVQFGVVNHSEADLGDLVMDVNLRTTAGKPDDLPVCSFSAKIPALGPLEMKPVTVLVPTKLRVYELPDWQFLKPDFQITSPQ